MRGFSPPRSPTVGGFQIVDRPLIYRAHYASQYFAIFSGIIPSASGSSMRGFSLLEV
jgi:hypothetical protein